MLQQLQVRLRIQIFPSCLFKSCGYSCKYESLFFVFSNCAAIAVEILPQNPCIPALSGYPVTNEWLSPVLLI